MEHQWQGVSMTHVRFAIRRENVEGLFPLWPEHPAPVRRDEFLSGHGTEVNRWRSACWCSRLRIAGSEVTHILSFLGFLNFRQFQSCRGIKKAAHWAAVGELDLYLISNRGSRIAPPPSGSLIKLLVRTCPGQEG